jgi:hypothetical protein
MTGNQRPATGNRHPGPLLLLALLALALLAACSEESRQAAQTVEAAIQAIGTTAVKEPAAIVEAPTAVIMAVTGTAVPAPDTPTAPPTAAPHPVATQEPTPYPGLIGPTDFPADVNPLTGLQVADPAILQHRPLAIKVANMARVRPQAGLNQADLVFEHYSEGGITRFTAVFYTNMPRRVGSVRSARLIDLEIPRMYDAAFGYSGSSYQIKEMIRESSFFDRVISPDYGQSGFWRIFDAQNPSPFMVDSLFTDALDLRAILAGRGQDVAPHFYNGMAFHPDPPPGGQPASEAEILYTGTNILWQLQPDSGRYARWSDGLRHEDANSGELLSFKNVVVIYAEHVNTEIIEDSLGSPSIQIRIWGQGPAVIFRDDQRYDGLWRREHPEEMLTFYTQDGQILPLAPGNTWFELVPLDFEGLFSRP